MKTCIKGTGPFFNRFPSIALCYCTSFLYCNIPVLAHFCQGNFHPMKMQFCYNERGRESEHWQIECCEQGFEGEVFKTKLIKMFP